MRCLAQWLIGGIPTSPAAARALAATMADWRYEGEAASSAPLRLRVGAMGVASVARVLVGVGLKGLPSAWRSPFLWRTICVLLMFVAGIGIFDPPERFVDVLSGWDLAVLATAAAVQSVLLVIPLVAFISEVTGRQSRQAPSAGALTLLAIAIALMVSLLPELANFQRHSAWVHFANAATPPPVPAPSVYRWLAGASMSPMTLTSWFYFWTTSTSLVVASIGFSTLAYQVRRRRALSAWMIGVVPIVAVPATAYGAMLVTGLLGLWWRDAAIGLWPIRGVVTLLSVTVLPFVLATYLARTTARRAAATGSKVAI
jgi:hypothetical protein